MSDRNERGQFAPGASGNPGGSRVGQVKLINRVQEVLAADDPTAAIKRMPPETQKLVRALLKGITKGNAAMMRMIVDRHDLAVDRAPPPPDDSEQPDYTRLCYRDLNTLERLTNIAHGKLPPSFVSDEADHEEMMEDFRIAAEARRNAAPPDVAPSEEEKAGFEKRMLDYRRDLAEREARANAEVMAEAGEGHKMTPEEWFENMP